MGSLWTEKEYDGVAKENGSAVLTTSWYRNVMRVSCRKKVDYSKVDQLILLVYKRQSHVSWVGPIRFLAARVKGYTQRQ